MTKVTARGHGGSGLHVSADHRTLFALTIGLVLCAQFRGASFSIVSVATLCTDYLDFAGTETKTESSKRSLRTTPLVIQGVGTESRTCHLYQQHLPSLPSQLASCVFDVGC